MENIDSLLGAALLLVVAGLLLVASMDCGSATGRAGAGASLPMVDERKLNPEDTGLDSSANDSVVVALSSSGAVGPSFCAGSGADVGERKPKPEAAGAALSSPPSSSSSFVSFVSPTELPMNEKPEDVAVPLATAAEVVSLSATLSLFPSDTSGASPTELMKLNPDVAGAVVAGGAGAGAGSEAAEDMNENPLLLLVLVAVAAPNAGAGCFSSFLSLAGAGAPFNSRPPNIVET